MLRSLRLSALVLCFLAFVARADVSLPDFERVELDNGVVLLISEKHDVPLVGLEATIRGGAIQDPEELHGVANLLAGMLEKGAGEEVGEAVELLGVLDCAAPDRGLETDERHVVFLADQQYDTVVELDALEVGKRYVGANAEGQETKKHGGQPKSAQHHVSSPADCSTPTVMLLRRNTPRATVVRSTTVTPCTSSGIENRFS